MVGIPQPSREAHKLRRGVCHLTGMAVASCWDWIWSPDGSYTLAGFLRYMMFLKESGQVVFKQCFQVILFLKVCF